MAARAIRTAGASFADRAGEVNRRQARVFPTLSRAELSTALPKPLQPQADWLSHLVMDGDRIELAVQRIEAALARIGAVADHVPPAGDAGAEDIAALQDRHDALHCHVETTLADLDALIGKLSA